MWEGKSSGAVNVRKSDFIESFNLRWKNRISARNGVYEIKKLQLGDEPAQRLYGRCHNIRQFEPICLMFKNMP